MFSSWYNCKNYMIANTKLFTWNHNIKSKVKKLQIKINDKLIANRDLMIWWVTVAFTKFTWTKKILNARQTVKYQSLYFLTVSWFRPLQILFSFIQQFCMESFKEFDLLGPLSWLFHLELIKALYSDLG